MDFSKIRNFLFLVSVVVVSVVFLFVIKTFAYPIFWAAIVAGVFYPLYRWLGSKINRPNLNTVIVLILTFLIIVIPLFFVSSLVIKESLDIYTAVTNNSSQIGAAVQGALNWIKHNPYTAGLNVDEAFWTDKLSELAKTITNFLLESGKNFTQNSLIFLLMFMIMFYALFFFVRDGERLLKKFMHLCPLGDKYEKMLYRKFTSTVRATLKGSLIVGLIQGALGAVMFLVAGIQGAAIWGVLMTLFAIIPGIGSYFIWFPAAIILLIMGKIWQGVFMIIFGALVIGTIDNILRPILVGKDTQMHPLLVLLSTLGGIAVFGISGFIIGPIITSLMLSFWEMYEHYYHNELNHN